MPIRPIDMQVLLPKSYALDYAKSNVVNKQENAMQMVQNQQAATTQTKQHQVVQLSESEAAALKKKEQKKEEQGSKKKKPKPNDPNKGHHLDIKV